MIERIERMDLPLDLKNLLTDLALQVIQLQAQVRDARD